MRTGETEEAETISTEPYLPVARRIAEALGHEGSCDCDVILHKGTPMLLDLNPRFGGGTPFYIRAGARLPRFLLDQLSGMEKAIDCDMYQTGLRLRKHFVVSEANHSVETRQ